MHNGLRMVAGGYYGDWMTGIIERLRGHHEPQEEAVFREILKHVPPAASMLELGGFWSYYSLWFKSQHSQQRQAYVIEPHPNHIAIGRANAALNDHDVTFIQAGVGAEDIKRINSLLNPPARFISRNYPYPPPYAITELPSSIFFIAIHKARRPPSCGPAKRCFVRAPSGSESSRPTAITSAGIRSPISVALRCCVI